MQVNNHGHMLLWNSAGDAYAMFPDGSVHPDPRYNKKPKTENDTIIETMKEVLENKQLYTNCDLYRVVAEKVFGEDKYTTKLRAYVKSVCFNFFYGSKL